jgi:hypothetical protein
MRRWQDSSTRPNLALSDQGPAQAPGTRSRVQALLRAAPRILCHGHGFDDCGLSGQRVLQLMIVAVGVTPLDLDGRALAAEKAPRQIVRHSAAVRDTVKTLHRRGHTAGTNIRLIGLAERCRPIQRAQSGSPAAGPAGSKSCARPARPTSHRPRPHRGRHPTPTASEMAQGYRRARQARGLRRPAGPRPTRLPSEPRPHARIDVFAAAPLRPDAVAKARPRHRRQPSPDLLCENIAHVPMVAFPGSRRPCVAASLARPSQPAPLRRCRADLRRRRLAAYRAAPAGLPRAALVRNHQLRVLSVLNQERLDGSVSGDP